MNTQKPQHTEHIQDVQGQHAQDIEHVEAFYTAVKRLGHWTTARVIDVRARRGAVQLDLRSAQIPDGDIEIRISAERSMLKLLVPQDVTVDERDLELPGRSKVKDHERHVPHQGRRIRLTGTLRRGEVRVTRGGMATLTAMFSREFIEDCRAAHRSGGTPVLPDPGGESGSEAAARSTR